MREGMIRSFAKETLGPEGREPSELYGKENFENRDEVDQAELIFKIQELVAERKDLVRTIKDLEKHPVRQKIVTKKVRGRRVARVLKVEGESHPMTKNAKNRLEEVKEELLEIGKIPGVTEAYENNILNMAQYAKTIHLGEQFRDSAEDLAAEARYIRTVAEDSSAGVLTGATLDHVSSNEWRSDRLNDIADAVSNPQEFTRRVIGDPDAYSEHIEKAEDWLSSLKKSSEDTGEEERELSIFIKLASKKLDEVGPGSGVALEQEVDEISMLDKMLRAQELMTYSEQFKAGQLIEIPSVQALIDEGMEHMRTQQPFLLAGHLGSGKTETAKEMARLYMLENADSEEIEAIWQKEGSKEAEKAMEKMRPEIFSGSEESTVYDLIGKLKLKGEDGATSTYFAYGPLGRAILEGKPIIIDEINTIPPEVLSRLNDLLLRKPGDMVKIQENGDEEIEIKPGFAVLATCNLGSQYAGIQEVNAAFKSRWVAKEVDYPDIDEIYDLSLTALIRDDRPRLPPEFPADEFDRLIDLTIATHEIQNIFSDKAEGKRYAALADSASPESVKLEKAVVSTRDLMRKILEPWKKGGFKKSLDDIIGKNILAAEVFSEDDQGLMTEVFLRQGFFKGWDEKKFRRIGVKSVSDKELNTIAQHINEYEKDNKDLLELKKKAKEGANLAKQDLLLGTKK